MRGRAKGDFCRARDLSEQGGWRDRWGVGRYLLGLLLLLLLLLLLMLLLLLNLLLLLLLHVLRMLHLLLMLHLGMHWLLVHLLLVLLRMVLLWSVMRMHGGKERDANALQIPVRESLCGARKESVESGSRYDELAMQAAVEDARR